MSGIVLFVKNAEIGWRSPILVVGEENELRVEKAWRRLTV
jgi:hypothetical protein